jgi:hypothetical protein
VSRSSPKTVATTASVEDFIAAVADDTRRADCQALLRMMQGATGERACLWGSAIVGFGVWRYRSASGAQGEWPVVAFSPRKHDLSLYLMPGFAAQASLLARLGRHKSGKSCLYVKRLADVDLAVLQQLIESSVAAMAPQRIHKEA